VCAVRCPAPSTRRRGGPWRRCRAQRLAFRGQAEHDEVGEPPREATASVAACRGEPMQTGALGRFAGGGQGRPRSAAAASATSSSRTDPDAQAARQPGPRPAPGPSRPDRRRSQARCVVACLGETADGMSATRWCRSSSAPVSPARCVRVSVPIRGSRASSSSSISDLDGTSMTPDRRRHRRPSSRSGDNPLCKSPSYAGSAAPASPASAAASSLRELMSNLP